MKNNDEWVENIWKKANENIFFTNSFVFLSAGEMSPSIVPNELL